MGAIAVPITSIPNRIRAMDAGRDLSAVADLVEQCFSGTLDPEGHGYLQQLRATARFAGLLGWASLEAPAVPLGGYVWEEERRVIGNVSLMPFTNQGKRCYLIANVAVHPDFRGRGIGSALTRQALEHARSHHAATAWLQVREDNPSAVHIYRTLGFHEHTRRTTWVSNGSGAPAFFVAPPPAQALPLGGRVSIGPRLSQHWGDQLAWLDALYPRELSWHLPCDRTLLAPGLEGFLQRLLALNFPRHWAATQDGRPLGVLSWRGALDGEDTLWLAAPEGCAQGVVSALLRQARRDLAGRRALNLNLPAGLAAQAVAASGFGERHTLIWMSLDL